MTCVPSDTSAKCPICEQPKHSTFLLHKDGFDLYKCSDCQHIFVWPIPSIEALKHIYSFANSYQVQDRTIYDDDTVISEKMRESLRQLESFCRRRDRLLDVGCSSGKFLWLARRHGWSSVYGVELNEDTAEIAKHNGLSVFVGQLALANYSVSFFDAIHLGDVIEHVPNPVETMSELCAFLEPEGVIVLATPNHDAFFPLVTFWLYRLFSMPWSHVTPPYHLNQFSEKSLVKLLQKAKLNVIHKQYRGCDLHYELGETHILRSFRQAVSQRRFFTAVSRLLFAVLTAIAYAVVYGIDRCFVWKKKDSQMLLVARKAACCVQSSASSVNVFSDNVA